MEILEGEWSNYDWTVLSVLLPAWDCSQTHTLLCLSHSPRKSLAMHCFGGSLPLPSWFQCIRADQDRGRQAGKNMPVPLCSWELSHAGLLTAAPTEGLCGDKGNHKNWSHIRGPWADVLRHRLYVGDTGCRYACLGPSTLEPAQTMPEGTDYPSTSLCQLPVWELVCSNPMAVFLDSPAGVKLRAWHLQGAQVPVLLLNSSVLYSAATTRCCAQTASRHVTHGSRVAVTFHLPLNPVSFPV